MLHLLREEQLEIADIPIARIADQFLQAIHELGLNQAADYLDMASRLVRLKAQMLLPRHSEEDGWEDPRAELVRRLLEYQQIREVAIWLGRAAELRAEQFARGYLPPPPALPPPPLVLNLLDLLTAVERVIAGIPFPVLHRVVARPLDVESATRRIEDLLLESGTDPLARRARFRADHRRRAIHITGPAGAGEAGKPPPAAADSLQSDGDRP